MAPDELVQGIRLIESPLVPPGTIIAVSPRAWRLEIESPPTSVDPYRFDATTSRYEARLAFGTTRKVTETDPVTWSRPRGWKGWLRRFKRIVGYEYRKAAGQLRQHNDPRAFSVVNGITS